MPTTKNRVSHSSTRGRPPTLAEQTSKVAEDVRELGSIALSSATGALGAVKERSGEALHGARDRGHEMLEKGQDQVQSARDELEEFIAESPLKAVLIAAGIGAFIGFSLRGR